MTVKGLIWDEDILLNGLFPGANETVALISADFVCFICRYFLWR